MNCPRCDSLTFPATGEEPPNAIDWRKCFACGNRFEAGIPISTLEDAMKGWTPERRKKFKETMAAKRGENHIVEDNFDDSYIARRFDIPPPSAETKPHRDEWGKGVLTCPAQDEPIECNVATQQEYFGLRGAWMVLMGKAKAVGL
jgi:hypothetical protein